MEFNSGFLLDPFQDDNLSCILTQREDPSFDVFSQLDWSKSTPEKNRAPTQITPK
jgi:hypothetical protein